jgi:Divergent InlB B-repeat domain
MTRCVSGPRSSAGRGAVAACIALVAGACMVPAAHGAQKLRVITSGDGAVTSADSRIDCGEKCTATYRARRHITLKAAPGPGFVFAHWKGACFGKSPRCIVVLGRRTTVRATSNASGGPFVLS